MELSIDASRAKLLAAIGPTDDVTFIRGHGNIGDDLIHAGTRQLLAGVSYREVSVHRLNVVEGNTALLSGSGAWCGVYQAMPQYLREAEARFDRVIVLPSSFDTSVEGIPEALSRTKAKVFARELVSYHQIRDLCDADIAHDTALYFDYRPYQQRGSGVLTAYREDPESAGRPLPRGNNDISVTCENLDEWLWTIARHELVLTDRAHVTIAAAMLGKRVEYGASNYHKVPAIADFSLRGLPVSRVEERSAKTDEVFLSESETVTGFRQAREQERRTHSAWLSARCRARDEIESIVPLGDAFVFVDDNQWGREPVADRRRAIPFLEKDGNYWGAPPDDATAIAELDRLRVTGAKFLIFAWTAFWWLEYYAGLTAHLDQSFRRVWQNERLIVFDLRP